MKIAWLFIVPVVTFAQIGLKHTGQMANISLYNGLTSWLDIDVDGDGVLEVNTGYSAGPQGGIGLLNVITGQMYVIPASMSDMYALPSNVCLCKCRNQWVGEFVNGSNDGIYVYDINTREIIFQGLTAGGVQRVVCRDYDADGLDDIFVFSPRTGYGDDPTCYTYQVYGVGSSFLASPGQTLDITTIGPDVLLTWQSVPNADGYRVLWSADPDAPCFTQVGYATSSTFQHIGFGDVPKGFYKVIAVTAGGRSGPVAGEGRR
ncbi:MAG: hypothetical protein Q8O14_15300 [bacterium]|nr:hypothetical protein [bacterium]